ncbi:uncharacterized protein YALI1_D16206g [Yarrowia lipolytica]|jgi:bud site selection protein 20|nr:hypothetical protein YALI1_D16206g [Yarrowia lipolytica]QNP98411.1 Bud site selection protein 20 [Yarrowia lipolytica]
MGRPSRMMYKTKRRTRDLDQILRDDMNTSQSIKALHNQEYDEEKPGLAQFYCIPCARYFETEFAKQTHIRGKVHKRRLKEIREVPYTQEEANMAAGNNVARYLARNDVDKKRLDEEEVTTMLTDRGSLEEVEQAKAASSFAREQEALRIAREKEAEEEDKGVIPETKDEDMA